MAWQVYELTGSALSLGLLGLARFFPALSLRWSAVLSPIRLTVAASSKSLA